MQKRDAADAVAAEADVGDARYVEGSVAEANAAVFGIAEIEHVGHVDAVHAAGHLRSAAEAGLHAVAKRAMHSVGCLHWQNV